MKLTSVTPYGSRLLVQQFKAEDKVGSIYVPDAAQKKPSQGLVLEVGPGIVDLTTGEIRPVRIDKGDYVLFAKHSGTPVNVYRDDGGQETYLLVDQESVLATFKGVKEEGDK